MNITPKRSKLIRKGLKILKRRTWNDEQLQEIQEIIDMFKDHEKDLEFEESIKLPHELD